MAFLLSTGLRTQRFSINLLIKERGRRSYNAGDVKGVGNNGARGIKAWRVWKRDNEH